MRCLSYRRTSRADDAQPGCVEGAVTAVQTSKEKWHEAVEQWNSVCALDDVLRDVWRQRFIACDAFDHGRAFALIEPVQRECSDIRSSKPTPVDLGAVGCDQ